MQTKCALVCAALALGASLGCGSDRGGGGAAELDAAQCSDTIDNDADGRADCADPGCAGHAFCGGAPPPDGGGPPSTCGPLNCGGCCSGNTCLGGTATDACGAGGGLCIDCGAGRTCSAAACAIDPASRWDIVVISATLPTIEYTGEAWDGLGGAPDPFVVAQVGSDTATPTRTSTVNDVFTATYNEVIATGVRADALQAFLAFYVYDEDATANDLVGACRWEIRETDFDGGEIAMTCEPNPAAMMSGFSLRFWLRRG